MLRDDYLSSGGETGLFHVLKAWVDRQPVCLVVTDMPLTTTLLDGIELLCIEPMMIENAVFAKTTATSSVKGTAAEAVILVGRASVFSGLDLPPPLNRDMSKVP